MDGKEALGQLPRGVLAAGDAKEKDRALRGEMSAGPSRDGLGLVLIVGPTLDDDDDEEEDDEVSAKERYQGLRESRWETVKEKREEEQEPIFERSKRREEARG